MIIIVKKCFEGGTGGKKVQAVQGVAGQAAVQGVNRLNQAHCGQEAQTYLYLKRQTIGVVGRIHTATGGVG